jgi:ribonucleoside-diphosphate reductase alpha chain
MENLPSQVQKDSAVAAEDEVRKTPPAADQPKQHTVRALKIDPVFCPVNVDDPFETAKWDLRTAGIKGEKGDVVFEQKECEVPSSWSQLATNVVVSKYFYGEVNTPERETSVRQLIHRVARTLADWGTEDGYFASAEDGECFYRELTWLCLHQHASFNSPVWFNVGLHPQYGVQGAKCNWHWDAEKQEINQPENSYEFPQGSACFIQSVGDNMEEIMELARSEAMLFKFGSGTGTDLSSLRSHREKLSGGGKPSGPLSFMRVYDQIAAVVKSGGKTRRAAKMQSLKITHPDVLEFIECKRREEEKARLLLAKGYVYEDAYSSVLFQNANLSVRLTDDFMKAVDAGKPWTTHWVTKPDVEGPTYQARDLMDKMAQAAWCCGDPGVQYDTTINRWHTCPNSGRINASNPCVTGDTLVATSEGYRRIGRLVGRSAEMIAGDGRRVFVDRVFATGHKQVYELKTRAGYRLRLTADHRVLTANRGDVPACELTVDDIVRLEKPGFGNQFVPAAFGELLGAALGDGCVSHGESEDFLFITLGNEEAAVAERLQENVAASKQWLELEDGRSLRATRITRTATGLRVGSSVRPLIDAMQEYAILDAGSSGKTITDKVFELDRPSQAAILRGLLTTDGTVANYGAKSQYVALDSTSLELLRQVQLLLLGFGIKAKVYENRRALGQTTALLPDGAGSTKAYPVEQVHSLRISREGRAVFEREIGFLPESPKAARLAELNRQIGVYREPLVDRVASLVACGKEDVFDLTEPVTDHFVANGLVVHNCSEYMFLDDSACNLASVNLMKFRLPDGRFDVERFTTACRLVFIAQEILIDHASYPTKRIATNSHRFRPIGLGYSNLGSLVMSAGLPYDSDAARGLCGTVTALLHGAANRTSAELAAAVGPFEAFAENREPMLNVMEMHWEQVEKIKSCPDYLKSAARKIWDDVLVAGRRHGFRNAQATVLAPTGTISFMMDCDTTGIEPDIALVKYKQLAGGGMLKIVNQTVPPALRNLGYSEPEVESIIAYVDKEDTIEGAADLKTEHLPVFDCAFQPANGTRSIPWKAHVRMMAAAQPFLSGAISKTVNMPKDSTSEDVAGAYIEGWRLGLKALAIYRDGSKGVQPVSTKTEGDKQEKPLAAPRRERLPDTRQSITHKFSIAGHEGYITVGLYPDGRPGELFITMAKEGSTIGGLMDCFGTAVSMSLQYGVPLEVYVNKFSHTRFEPMGHTKNPDIRIAKSLVDYIFRWLGMTFIPGFGDSSKMFPGMSGEFDRSDPSDTEAETGPAATKAGGPNAGPGSAATPESNAADGEGNGNSSHRAKANGQSNGSKRRSGASAQVSAAAASRTVSAPYADLTASLGSPSAQFATFQEDAPSCDHCGAITVRNGNCYLCYNCGNSMGCS